MERYVTQNGKALRCGYTTGTCAAAAAAAAVKMFLCRRPVEGMLLTLPGGEQVEIPILFPKWDGEGASCGVRKDGGDDPDVTNGALIFVHVYPLKDGELLIEGGQGVGRVTKPGLPCGVGEAAINPVPRQMIAQNIRQIDPDGGYRVVISVPEGERLAAHTFNPSLGIVGGISIIGTTGIVEPMSEKALVDSIRLEMSVRRAEGFSSLAAVPGNYGLNFLKDLVGKPLEGCVKYSNYLGEMLDFSRKLGFGRLLIVGHAGKMVKVAGGMMNTHSSNGDFRMEVLGCYAALAGGSWEQIARLWEAATTEEAVSLLVEWGLCVSVMDRLVEKITAQVGRRLAGAVPFEVMVYTNRHGLVGQSLGAQQLLREIVRQEGDLP